MSLGRYGASWTSVSQTEDCAEADEKIDSLFEVATPDEHTNIVFIVFIPNSGEAGGPMRPLPN